MREPETVEELWPESAESECDGDCLPLMQTSPVLTVLTWSETTSTTSSIVSDWTDSSDSDWSPTSAEIEKECFLVLLGVGFSLIIAEML